MAHGYINNKYVNLQSKQMQKVINKKNKRTTEIPLVFNNPFFQAESQLQIGQDAERGLKLHHAPIMRCFLHIFKYALFVDVVDRFPGPRVLIASTSVCEGTNYRMEIVNTCGWENVELASFRANAVQQYKASLRSKRKPYDIILMRDIGPDRLGADGVKDLRDLGFKGYLICVCVTDLPEHTSCYLEEGANKIMKERGPREQFQLLREGQIKISSYFQSTVPSST